MSELVTGTGAWVYPELKWTQKVGHNLKVQMKRNFSIEEKLSAIGLVFQGESARSVSRKLHLDHHKDNQRLQRPLAEAWHEQIQERRRGKTLITHGDRNVV